MIKKCTNSLITYIKTHTKETLFVTLITVAAIILRLIVIKNYGNIIHDEMYSWYFASQSNFIKTIHSSLSEDVHMPLYFVLLHFWIKIFSDSNVSMHLCTLVLTIPLFPLTYYISKELFNKTTGYFAILYTAICAFCAYYCVTVRFYGITFVLGLLSSYFFVKMLSSDKKIYLIGFIISDILLSYAFSITPLLTFGYFLIACIYIFAFKREYIKKLIFAFSILFLANIPLLVFIINNIINIKNTALCSFVGDLYIFNWKVIFDICENFFSNENYVIVTQFVNTFYDLPDKLQSSFYLICVFIPILICLFGFIKSLLSKNKTLYLFLLPSILFLILSLLFGSIGFTQFITRYASIIFPVVIICMCYGLSLIKIRVVSFLLYAILIVLNLICLFLSEYSILNNTFLELKDLKNVLNNVIKIESNDLVLIPYSGRKTKIFVPRGKLINFSAEDAILLKDKKSKELYFGKNFKNITKYNVRTILRDDILKDIPHLDYEENLYNRYISKMKQNDRLIIISARENYTLYLSRNWELLKDKSFYYDFNKYIFLVTKMLVDSIQIADKYLVRTNMYENIPQNYTIYIFEKL